MQDEPPKLHVEIVYWRVTYRAKMMITCIVDILLWKTIDGKSAKNWIGEAEAGKI